MLHTLSLQGAHDITPLSLVPLTKVYACPAHDPYDPLSSVIFLFHYPSLTLHVRKSHDFNATSSTPNCPSQSPQSHRVLELSCAQQAAPKRSKYYLL